MYNELLVKANEEIAKVMNYINEHKDMFDMMDLKLHDVSYYTYSEMEKDFPLCYESGIDYFSYFCEDEYENFIEWCRENDIDFDKMRHNVGRTSKFYLHNWHDTDIDFMMYNIINECGCWYYCDYINLTNGFITSTDIETYENETLESLEYFANDLWNDFKKEIEDIEKVYDYISCFKKNQIDNFKGYLDGFEDMFQYEKEVEEKQKKESEKICSDIQNKYSISNEDMDTLQRNIHNWNC